MHLLKTSYLLLLKRAVFAFFVLSTLISISGCKQTDKSLNKTKNELLDGIEAQMFQHPENLDSLLGKIDTTHITPNEQARIRTIRGLTQFNNGEFDKCIKELEKAETVFINQEDFYHSNVNKLIRAFTFEYLKLDKNATDLYVDCEAYFDKNHFDKFKFYASLGLLRLSKQLILDENTLINQLKQDAKRFNDPIFNALLYSTIGDIEKNDSLSIINYEMSICEFSRAHRWSRVYTIELKTLFTKLRQNPSETAQLFYENFPNKKYSFVPTSEQQLSYRYGQAYLFALQGKNKPSIEVANQVLNEAVASNSSSVESDCVHLLAVLYKKISDFKNAHMMLERYHALVEKSRIALQQNQLLALGAHYRYAKLEQEKLDLKDKVQKSILLLAVIVLFFIVLFSFGWFSLKESRYKQVILQSKNIEIMDQINNLLSSLDKQEEKNDMLIQQVEGLKVQYNDSYKISQLLQALDKKQIATWMEYETCFLSLRPGWVEKLKQEMPELTATDLKYCMCLYFNLNNYTISKLCDVGLDAIKSAKKRIRNKFSLDDATEIYVFLKKFD